MVEVLINLVPVVLTLLVLSRLAGDNPAFRVVQYLFVGVSLGYAFVVVYHQVLRPSLIQTLASADDSTLLSLRAVPYVLGILLLPRILGRQTASWLANIPLALLFGVGAALALGGALAGTLRPQLLDTVRITATEPFQLAGAVLVLLGVIITLSYFYFTIPRQSGVGRLVAGSAQLGRWLLMIAFGFFFAGAVFTYITALNERLAFIVSWARGLIGF